MQAQLQQQQQRQQQQAAAFNAAFDDYKNSARQFMDWIRHATALMDDRNMPSTMEEVKVSDPSIGSWLQKEKKYYFRLLKKATSLAPDSKNCPL